MMGDDGPSEHPKPVEFLNVCLEDSLQPHPEVQLRETCSPPDSPEPCGDQTLAFDPPDPIRQDGPPGDSCASPTQLGNSSPQGSPQEGQSNSTQVMFWEGILQARMCVLDLEEELEKTEGLRTDLRCCLPAAPADLPTFSASPSDPQDSGLHPSPCAEEASGEDGSGPEGESQIPVCSREGSPGSSPEWGPEEESVFFDNPLFLESPCSDTSSSGARFSWDFSASLVDVRTAPESPQTQGPPLPEARVPWEQGSEPDCGGGTAADSNGHSAPLILVPTYKTHFLYWATPDTTEGASVEPPDQDESEPVLGDSLNPAPSAAPCVQEASAWEAGHAGSEPSSATHHVQPWAQPSPEEWQTEEGPLLPEGKGDRDAECPQESASYTLVPGPWGSPAFSPEPNSPESESRGRSPSPSPEPSQESSTQLQDCHTDTTLPERTLDASCPLLLEIDGAEPSSLEKEEEGATPGPEKEVSSEGPAGPAAGVMQPDAHLTPTEGLPEDPMPRAHLPVEDQKSQAGDKLANGVSTDKVAWNLASRLYHLEGFRKSEVAAHLRKNNDFSRAVAAEYLSFFHFGGQNLDRALRQFLQALVLSGETQERERILYQFSRRFHYCNPGVFSSVDCVHTLTCAIMLLNTDLHGQNIGKSMSCQEFINNLNGLKDGGNFPKELLKTLYWSIRSEKLEWAVDEEDTSRPEKAPLSPPIGKMGSPFLQLAQDPTAPTYKQGILTRKMHHDADGKKTAWGKRGWKMFHTLLRGMVLYFLKGEDPPPPEGEILVGQMVDEPVGVHHSLATPATHYTKKPHVFQLRTADWRLYLFQAPTAKEMSSWIARINLAAAMHSAPPFPAAVGSQRRFVRPIMPMGPANSSLEEQHRSHENCLDAASDDLLDLQRNLPERRGRSRELEEYRLRKEYLEHEKTRYETYVQLLVVRLHCSSDDLDLWEEQLGREAGDLQEPKPSLKKSHSSPSLHQDEAPTTAKVKRNISERRTYRKIIPKRNRNQL
ncbi:PREDICTED: PH and SEC7 domain-containing protein 4 isoform X2 [Condylura cristata]|uniref:PH and SEC7 domain-containing protein 4 isoform X2 n=1 Tax=Condylura cristata TaxID=143302 RepID=UPI00064398AB|nr:PREDICTED: PH and SEC7 domain-containing protein 4 isoform X2 [Condylura cristata]